MSFVCGKVDLSLVIIYDSVGIVNSLHSILKGFNIWLVMINQFVQNCGSKLKYDKVSRIVRTKGGKTSWIEIERFRCPFAVKYIESYQIMFFRIKQYEAEVIRGVLEGFITCEAYGYEDYPCEMTMIRWRNSQARNYVKEDNSFCEE